MIAISGSYMDAIFKLVTYEESEKQASALQKQKGYFNPARVISVAALCAYIVIEYSKHQMLIICSHAWLICWNACL